MVPFLLKWHHFWLIVTWNIALPWCFFLPRAAELMLVLGGLEPDGFVD